MFTEPESLARDLDLLEGIETGSIRLVTQALYDFRETAAEIFRSEPDLAADIGEDITREALDRMGVSKIEVRLFGKMDYKRARYVFNRNYAIRQALLVDSKAEKVEGQATATLQTAQTSIWSAGRDAPTRGEAFRVRLVFASLKAKMRWRVQTVPMAPQAFVWED